jgi:hypothetical protein
VVLLFIYGLCKDNLRISDYRLKLYTVDEWLTWDLQGMWKEPVVECFRYL